MNSNITHQYTRPGKYSAVLTITDGDYNTITSQAIVITVSASNLSVSVAADPSSGFPPLDVTFRATPQGGESPYLVQNWNWGDGSQPDTSQGGQAMHTYETDGDYTATINIEDATLTPASGSATVLVGPSTVAPSSMANQINLASFQNGVINIVTESVNNNPGTDVVATMIVQILDSTGALVSAQQRQVTIPAGKSDTEGFIFQPSAPGTYIVVFQLWTVPPPNGTELGTSQTSEVTVS